MKRRGTFDKQKRLMIAVLSAACMGITLFAAVECYREGAAANAPDWRMYAVVSAAWAVNAAAWLVSWLRYDRTHQRELKEN